MLGLDSCGCEPTVLTCCILQVYFGVKGGALTQTAVAKSDTYTAAEMCGIIANSSGYIYPGALLLIPLASTTRCFGTCWRLRLCCVSQKQQSTTGRVGSPTASATKSLLLPMWGRMCIDLLRA